MTDNNENDKAQENPPIINLEEARAAAQRMVDKGVEVVDQKVDTEQVGRHARRIRDKVELFVYDNKLEIATVIVFTAGFWAGRRVLARGFLRQLSERERAYLELAISEKQVKKLLKNKDNLALLFDTPDGTFALRATE